MLFLVKDIGQTLRLPTSIGSLFGSNIGISLLSEAVRQMSQVRCVCVTAVKQYIYLTLLLSDMQSVEIC